MKTRHIPYNLSKPSRNPGSGGITGLRIMGCVSLILWPAGFILAPQYMPYVFWSALGLIGVGLLVSAIRDKLQERKDVREILAASVELEKVNAEIAKRVKDHAERKGLYAKRQALMNIILRG